MNKRTIEISGIPVEFKASAALPRLYRLMFQRDIFRDFSVLCDDFQKAEEQGGLGISSLEVFENIAFCMMRHAGGEAADIDAWLEQFDTFSIYEILPQLMDMWRLNMQTQVEAKKNLVAVAGK